MHEIRQFLYARGTKTFLINEHGKMLSGVWRTGTIRCCLASTFVRKSENASLWKGIQKARPDSCCLRHSQTKCCLRVNDLICLFVVPLIEFQSLKTSFSCLQLIHPLTLAASDTILDVHVAWISEATGSPWLLCWDNGWHLYLSAEYNACYARYTQALHYGGFDLNRRAQSAMEPILQTIGTLLDGRVCFLHLAQDPWWQNPTFSQKQHPCWGNKSSMSSNLSTFLQNIFFLYAAKNDFLT